MIIVFAGTDQDAEVIKFAQSDAGEVGSLTAVVRHADDDAIETTDGHHDRPAGRPSTACAIPDIVEQLNEEAGAVGRRHARRPSGDRP